MNTRILIVLVAAAALLNVCAAGPVIDWMKNNKDTTTAAELLQQLYPKPISEKAKFTILVPTNNVSATAADAAVCGSSRSTCAV
jgi:hypothetical protein